MAKETFRKMKTIFTNRNITINTKIDTLKAYVWSVLLYGCECWTLSKYTEKESGGCRDVVSSKNVKNVMDRTKT